MFSFTFKELYVFKIALYFPPGIFVFLLFDYFSLLFLCLLHLCIFANTFVLQDVFLYVQKSLAPLKSGIDATFFIMTKIIKTSRINLRLSADELDRLRELSKDYSSLSAFILDACWHYNRKTDYGILNYFDERCKLIAKFRPELNHLGGNLNQLIQYTNHCMIMGIYQENTAEEIKRVQNEILDCLLNIKAEFMNLEKDFRKVIKQV